MRLHQAVVEVFFALYLLAQIAALVALVAMAISRSCSPEPAAASTAVYVSDEELDALGARLLAASARTREWEQLAERHREATGIACEQMTQVALTWEAR